MRASQTDPELRQQLEAIDVQAQRTVRHQMHLRQVEAERQAAIIEKLRAEEASRLKAEQEAAAAISADEVGNQEKAQAIPVVGTPLNGRITCELFMFSRMVCCGSLPEGWAFAAPNTLHMGQSPLAGGRLPTPLKSDVHSPPLVPLTPKNP